MPRWFATTRGGGEQSPGDVWWSWACIFDDSVDTKPTSPTTTQTCLRGACEIDRTLLFAGGLIDQSVEVYQATRSDRIQSTDTGRQSTSRQVKRQKRLANMGNAQVTALGIFAGCGPNNAESSLYSVRKCGGVV